KEGEEVYRSPLILVPVDLEKSENQEKYSLVYNGEEVRLNISLITKIKSEYNIDISLDEDEDIKDIDAYFRSVDEKVKNREGFEVEATKGAFDFFSYAKYLMYKDLDLDVWTNEKGELDNDVLKKLFVTNFDDKLTDNNNLERDLTPSKIYNVVDADSSQAKVIYEILQGKNMVIQGPPGTGKSQTITNIIASNLVKGKSVLFVSEKKAALEVVKRRLENIGLGDLVLELHSEKTNKKDVLHSIEQTLSLGEPKDEEDNELEKKYDLTKFELDEYKRIVNSTISNSSLPLIEVYGEALKIKNRLDELNVRFPRMSFKDISIWSHDDFTRKLDIAKEFEALVLRVGKIEKHPLYGITLEHCLPYEQVTLKEKLSDLEDSLADLISTISEIGSIFQNKSINTLFDSGRLINSINALEKYRSLALINVSDLYLLSSSDDVTNLIKLAKNFQEEIKKEYKDTAYLESKEYVNKYEEYEKLSFFKKKKSEIPLELNKYFFLNKVSNKDRKNLYLHLKKYNLLMSNEAMFKYLFKEEYKGLFSTDWNHIINLLNPAKEFLEKLSNYSILSQTRQVIYSEEKIDELIDLRQTYFERKKDFEDKLHSFFTFAAFDSLKRFDYNYWYLDCSFVELKRIIHSWIINIDSVIDVVRYNSLVHEFKNEGMEELLNYYYDTNKVEYLDLILSFEYYDALINYAYSLNSTLSSFKEFKIERLISLFKELDAKMMVENIKKVLKVHYSLMPKINDNSKDMALIRRELNKKRNKMPIRRLLLKASSSILKIKPVFMMSPISVASFLPPKEVVFDLVVFDEASQVRPVEAFGALLRAKQIVVVGDSKQLPPTNFFDNLTNKYDEVNDEDYDVSNMESILTLLLAMNIPQRTLSWHYRSRNRSLISLSNNEFYEGELKVFPSVYDSDPSKGLVFNYIKDSFYARGTTRVNKIEAKEVIKAVFEHAKNNRDLSLGVASFSLAQQEELYKEFEAQLKKCTDEEVKSFFTMHKDEPFFIKNLESVQGDERDVIFISIGYGYDEDGHITMDFGPLNKDGGERRLNVLITRAKVKCEVFSNITCNDINLSKTDAKGVVALKRFLDYAQNRIIYLNRNKESCSDDFIDFIYDKLLDYGYVVDKNIGKDVGIDLAIFDKAKNRYVVGLECDGGAYKNLVNTTDRERIRRNVLKSLGWKIYHVWSPDFYRNPKNEFDKILDFIQEASEEEESEEIKKEFELNLKRKQAIKVEIKENYVPYKVFQSVKRRAKVLLEEENLSNLVYKIVKVEAPIHINLLKRRLMDITSVSKLSDEQVNLLAKVVQEDKFKYKDEFVYLSEGQVYQVRNRSLLDKYSKKVEYISKEEIDEAIRLSLNRGEASTEDEIVKMVFTYFGFNSSKVLKDLINVEIEKMLASNILTKEDEVIYLE
ncbi:MAG: AAA domain-containing protein, partial [Bacilli bacterium]|nr:AAA domain-containing protein [Bacilli bacterium]